jgi:hypothetical protein
VGNPQTDPDGRRYLDGKQCASKTDPNATLSSRPVGFLIGRIGSGPWFAVGSDYSETVSRDGRLFLLYNEAFWNDDLGTYSVTIAVR